MINLFASLASLAFLWALFFWLYRDYRLDRFRESLFALRGELFHLAANGEIDFNSDAYGMLRSTINGTIQFGHRLGFVQLLAFFFFVPRKPANDYACAYHNQWTVACGKLRPEVRERLFGIRRQVHALIAEQIVLTSALLTFTLVTAIGWLAFRACGKYLQDIARKALESAIAMRVADRLDSAAFLSAAR